MNVLWDLIRDVAEEFLSLFTLLIIHSLQGAIYVLAFSPDGKYLASAGKDGTDENVHICVYIQMVVMLMQGWYHTTS